MRVAVQDKQKALLASVAAELVHPDMLLGLGTGSTVDLFILELGKKFGRLSDLRVVPTSKSSAQKAANLGIEVLEPSAKSIPDILIDGADEVSRNLSMIKGGGGALLWEKIVAHTAKKRIYIVDETKLVERLGKFPLPVEVVKFGHEWSRCSLQSLFDKVSFRRTAAGEPFETDSGNFIYDCDLNPEINLEQFDKQLSSIPGVVTSGLFLGFIDCLLTVRKGNVLQINGSSDVFW
ncbi:MAG: ribose 5-phosphate isomerase A [Rhodospirillaceae bacterium]|nr:ribose 5-phosphate isomerase A [Rhodospirillaceae bacterium]|tara:strand:+ start:1012 stop:1716 length:705 start_codon:yes stop_codon:yes gene_type:complete